MPSCDVSRSRISFRLGATLAGLLCVLGAGAVSAQTPPPPVCLADQPPLLHQSLNCLGTDTIDKYFETSVFEWSGSDQLIINTGNDLQLWDIDNPQNPFQGDSSSFGVPNQGDSDYDLMNYSICDDCRYGIATYKLGNVLFDFGTAGTPTLNTKQYYPTGLDPRGGFTFKFNNQQYLLANFLPDDCGGDATLYRFNGVSSIEAIGCVDVPGFAGKIMNGFKVVGGTTTYLYLGFTDNRIYIYEVQPFGNLINLSYTGNNALRAFLGRGKGMAIDPAAKLAVTTFTDGMRIYDITNPASPVQRSFVSANLGLAAIRYPFLWVARNLSADSTRTYDIENPSNPVELDPNFWDPLHPWNSHSDECEWPTSAVFSPDASTMYFARYAVVQMIDFTACAGPVQPTASMGISPDQIFPGDVATVTDTSIGTVERRAIWVTSGADPASGVVCPPGGVIPDLSTANPQSLNCTIVQSLPATAVRYAHVAVDNTDYPCGGASPLTCPDQQTADAEIAIDRTPEAFITIVPPNPITGGTVNLNGTFEGTEGGTDPFDWQIFRDNVPVDSFSTQNVPNYQLTDSGLWRFEFTVQYDHEQSTGVLYFVTAIESLPVSSVAADFTVTPTARSTPSRSRSTAASPTRRPAPRCRGTGRSPAPPSTTAAPTTSFARFRPTR